MLCWNDLTKKEQNDEDSDDRETSSYFRYKGTVYSLNDFLRTSGETKWHGYMGLTNTSALVVKLSNDYENIKVGLAF